MFKSKRFLNSYELMKKISYEEDNKIGELTKKDSSYKIKDNKNKKDKEEILVFLFV